MESDLDKMLSSWVILQCAPWVMRSDICETRRQVFVCWRTPGSDCGCSGVELSARVSSGEVPVRHLEDSGGLVDFLLGTLQLTCSRWLRGFYPMVLWHGRILAQCSQNCGCSSPQVKNCPPGRRRSLICVASEAAVVFVTSHTSSWSESVCVWMNGGRLCSTLPVSRSLFGLRQPEHPSGAFVPLDQSQRTPLMMWINRY